jgi:hypothetical protein
MLTKKTILSRRTVLRGVLAGGGLATIPLPRLNAMLNGNGTAYAASNAPLRRFGVYFIGNGFVPEFFAPQPRVTGPFGPLPTQLAPLEKVRSKITIVSGFELKTGRPNDTPHGHFPGGLTGANGAGRVYHLPSIDQVIADGSPLGMGVPFKSVQIAVSNADPGVGQKMYHAISGKGPNLQNDPEYSPMAQFNRLFTNFTPQQPGAPVPAMPDPTIELDRSILDGVIADANDLGKRLGREDTARLQAHLDGIRAIENRLTRTSEPGAGAGASCKKITMGVAQDNSGSLNRNTAAAHDDLMVMAMACDLTRVFSYQLTKPAAHVNYGIPGCSGDFHGICHADAGFDQPKVQMGIAHTMDIFSDLLMKMDAIKEGPVTMLDNSTIIVSTCVAWGKTHCPWEWPCIIAGRGGVRTGADGAPDPNGRLNFTGGWHYRSDADNFSKVLMTLANLNGTNLKTFGKDGGMVDTEIHEIRGPNG